MVEPKGKKSLRTKPGSAEADSEAEVGNEVQGDAMTTKKRLTTVARRQSVPDAVVERAEAVDEKPEKTSGWNVLSVTSISPGWHAYYRSERPEVQRERRALIGWLVIEVDGRCSTVPGVFHQGEMVPATAIGDLSYITDPQNRRYT
jgi:hypothetical protein